VLLTATPHSGDDAAFYRLLGLLDPDFEPSRTPPANERERLRERLANHFVQRRRPDIEAWSGRRRRHLFPQARDHRAHLQAHRRVGGLLGAPCSTTARGRRQRRGRRARQRLNFWGTLALLRCVASSPGRRARPCAPAPVSTTTTPTWTGDELLDRLFDGDRRRLPDDDLEPPAATDDPALAALVDPGRGPRRPARRPEAQGRLTEHVKPSCSPTASTRWSSAATSPPRTTWPSTCRAAQGHPVAVVTGELTPTSARRSVAALGDADRRVLVATDCLSEGINLQSLFDAVVHYDLSWNPTRHEQREGRVDRFGQPSRRWCARA
jgi:hypothetical protein